MIRLDLTTIRLLLAVHRLSSFTRAAEQENIAASAVSKRIQDIEADLDLQLFRRHPRGVTTTEAGEIFVRHAKELIGNLTAIELDLQQYARGDKGCVNIHAHSTAVSQSLPAEIASFAREYPEVRIILREDLSANVLQAVADGFSDIGIFATNLTPPDFLHVFPYHTDRLVVFLPHHHEFAERESLDFSEIAASAQVSFERDSSLRALLAGKAQAMGIAVNDRIQVASFTSAMKMVDAGFGVAILPDGIVRSFGARLAARAVPLSNEWALRRLALCTRDTRRLTGAAKLMLSHLRRCAAP